MSNARGRAAAGTFAVLLAAYLVTFAPSVTLWDAGEFNAAIASLGIPHPPGTPLYILIARVWSQLVPGLGQAAAVNSLSAVATAIACGTLAWLSARWFRSGVAGLAGGICAGAMLSVWRNATETEVYALSLLLAVLFVAVGDRAGRDESRRFRVLLVYLMALAVPLQISALVAAPAGILLASQRDGARASPLVLMSLGGAFLLITGVGVMSRALVVAGLVILLAATWRQLRAPDAEHIATRNVAAAVAIGVSATLFLLVRAAHDPGINQGNPATWQGLVDVVARRQYDVPPLWPRRAPFWLQLGNVVQYADWQVASGLYGGVGPGWLRTPWTVLFALLAIAGGIAHHRRDPRSARAVALLLLSATIGVACVLNLRAGPSFGAGILPDSASHEPRERDYFFAVGFLISGIWAGAGAVVVSRRIARGRSWMGLAIAGLPLALNWRAADRRREPDASLARVLGEALLASSAPRAVLLLAGDNDSYATWYQQRVNHMRQDVTPVTVPLLGAVWYRRELARRDSLLSMDVVEHWYGEESTLQEIAREARRMSRPLAASISLSSDTRDSVASQWILSGLVYVAQDPSGSLPGGGLSGTVHVDSAATAARAAAILRAVPALGRPVDDPAGAYVARLLSCPQRVLGARTGLRDGGSSLDSRCNFK